MMVIYVVYHKPSKKYISTSGYYGNETNIKGYASKEKAKVDYRSSEYQIKQMRITP